MHPHHTDHRATAADRARGPRPSLCPGCGRPVAEMYETVSRHATSEGLVVWARCACGALQASRYRTGAAEVVTRGGGPGPPR